MQGAGKGDAKAKRRGRHSPCAAAAQWDLRPARMEVARRTGRVPDPEDAELQLEQGMQWNREN